MAEKRRSGAPDAETLARTLELPGHRSAVRGVALSPDGDAVATASQHAVKVWSAAPDTAPVLFRTLATKRLALCVKFLPGGGPLKTKWPEKK